MVVRRAAFIGIGANIGARRQNIARAVQEIGAMSGVELLALSSLFQNRPVGFESRHLFLNGVLAVSLSDQISPMKLMSGLLEIERRLGRDRGAGMDRTIDLDLLHVEGIRIHELGPPALTLPHPRIGDRPFVLIPWAEIAPQVVPAGLGRSIIQMLKQMLKAHPDAQEGLERESRPVLYKRHPLIQISKAH